jgi:hypothetical protein
MMLLDLPNIPEKIRPVRPFFAIISMQFNQNSDKN